MGPDMLKHVAWFLAHYVKHPIEPDLTISRNTWTQDTLLIDSWGVGYLSDASI